MNPASTRGDVPRKASVSRAGQERPVETLPPHQFKAPQAFAESHSSAGVETQGGRRSFTVIKAVATSLGRGMRRRSFRSPAQTVPYASMVGGPLIHAAIPSQSVDRWRQFGSAWRDHSARAVQAPRTSPETLSDMMKSALADPLIRPRFLACQFPQFRTRPHRLGGNSGRPE